MTFTGSSPRPVENSQSRWKILVEAGCYRSEGSADGVLLRGMEWRCGFGGWEVGGESMIKE